MIGSIASRYLIRAFTPILLLRSNYTCHSSDRDLSSKERAYPARCFSK